MIRSAAIVGVLVVLIASGAQAEEPSKGEVRFLKALTSGLDHDSADVRASAQKALQEMGAKAAWYVLRELRRYKGDKLTAAQEVLIALREHTESAIDALEKSGKLNSSTEKALTRVRAALAVKAELKKDVGKVEAPIGNPKAAAQVDKILADAPSDRWSSHSPIIDQLVELGRGAIPQLLNHLDPSNWHDGWARPNWAISALGKLCQKEDIPHLGELFDKGWTKVAAVFEKLRAKECVPFLIRALERGQLTHDIGSACKAMGAPELRIAAVAFIKEHGKRFESGTSELLEMLATMRAVEVLPAIQDMQAAREDGGGTTLDTLNRIHHDKTIGTALARLGDPVGIEMLIPLLDPGPDNAWMATWVGRILNEVTGQTFAMKGGDNAAAYDKYTRWWKKNKGRLTWNKETGVYERK